MYDEYTVRVTIGHRHWLATCRLKAGETEYRNVVTRNAISADTLAERSGLSSRTSHDLYLIGMRYMCWLL